MFYLVALMRWYEWYIKMRAEKRRRHEKDLKKWPLANA